jgi:hypothetical protein
MPHATPVGLTGERYEDTVPDTLDLVERAALGLNYFTGMTEPDLDHEMYFHAQFDQSSPPVLKTHVTSLGACQAKALEAMAYLRTMSGSTQGVEQEARMVEMMSGMLGDDGLLWVDGSAPGKPWLQIPERFAMVHGQGRMARAMMAWYQYSGDPVWKERLDALVTGLDKMLVHDGDRAYFPTHGYYDNEYLRSCYSARGWKDTSEPSGEKDGEEGSLFNHQGHVPGVLANWHLLTGNEEALKRSGELVRFLASPRFWSDYEAGDYPAVVGSQHAHWTGHLHGHVNTLRAILEYSVATDDAQMKAFARDGYEWARQALLPRIGYFDYQGCATARMIGLAVKLSDAGVGDYWEDVDQYIRNHGVEMQITPDDADYLAAMSEGKPPPKKEPGTSTENVFERTVGGFALWSDKSWVGLCCGTHGNMGLFYAWDGALRHEDGTVRVNLLLNRASEWLDVHSYLPYEGKVVLRNKTATEAFVRVPLWADKSAVRCSVDGGERTPSWFGSYLRFRDLKPGESITVRFPMVEATEEWAVNRLTWPGNIIGEEQVHTCRFRGNTLVDIDPGLSPGSPLYRGRKALYATSQAPTKKVSRYVSPVTLIW